MKYKVCLLFLGLFFNFILSGYSYIQQPVENDTARIHTIIVIFDGLRPDYIQKEWMPRLYAFRDKGVYGKNHHSVFPTVTRVNAASYITGSYPAQHGLIGNNIFIPEVNALKSLSTGDADHLMEIMKATSGKLLTSPSLGEILQSSGEQMYVYSSGSTGQAFLQNHTVNGAVINPELILPEDFRQKLIAEIGVPPKSATPNIEKHRWITDALCQYSLKPQGPLVSAIWFSDPDGTAHEYGIGVPITIQSLQAVDAAFGRILDSIQVRGLEKMFNIIVTADHGFVTHTGKQGVSALLIEKGLKKDKASDDVILAGGAIHVKDHNRKQIKKITGILQQEEWVGAVFTRSAKPGSVKGWVKGTLSFESIYWNHPQRAADILVTVNWNNTPNSLGFSGSDFATGVAGHGGASSHEIHIPLIAYGPSFAETTSSELPTSNIDIVPTLLYINQIPIPNQMQGRVMNELLINNTIPVKTTQKEIIRVHKHFKSGKYDLKMETTIVEKYRYINYLSVTREY